MVHTAYTSADIRNPYLCEMINLVCDAGEIMDGSTPLKPESAMDLAKRLSTFGSSLASHYVERLELSIANAILNGEVRFEPKTAIDLKAVLQDYHHSPLASEYAARLDELGYMMELSRSTNDGLVDFHPDQARYLMRELEPYTSRSQEIERLWLNLHRECERVAASENTTA